MDDSDCFFLPYQRKWIEDRSRLKLMEKARQVGMSWSCAYSVVRRAALGGSRQEFWVSSRDELQARLFLRDCRHFADALSLAGRGLAKGRNVLETASSLMSLELCGSRIHSLSSNPDAQAGKRGSRILDEFALHPNPHRLFAVALPGITWGGSLEIISTHRGQHHFFNQLIEEILQGNPKGFSHHRVTLQDALEQGFLERLKGRLPEEDPRRHMDAASYFDFVRQSCPDEATFLQEYMCQPSDEASAFLQPDLICACESPSATLRLSREAALNNGQAFFLGVDIGRERDLTVFWLLEKVEDVFFTREVRCLEKMPFASQEAVLDEFLSLPACRRVWIDATGIGRQFAERAERRYGKYRVNGVTFTAPLKESLAYPLRGAFESRSLRIPADAAVRADLQSVRLEPSASGARLLSGRLGGSHADRFWALALAFRAATENPGGFAFRSLNRTSAPFAD